MMIDAYKTSQEIMAETGLSAAELAALPMSEYARLSGRPSFGQIATATLGYDEPESPARDTVSAPEAAQANADAAQGIDPDSAEYFHAWRAQRQRGGEGKGIFDSVGREAWIAAAQKQPGRSALQGGNVEAGPDMTRRKLPSTPNLDTRPAVQRFTFPGSAYQG